jgi:hypothetical protein
VDGRLGNRFLFFVSLRHDARGARWPGDRIGLKACPDTVREGKMPSRQPAGRRRYSRFSATCFRRAANGYRYAGALAPGSAIFLASLFMKCCSRNLKHQPPHSARWLDLP